MSIPAGCVAYNDLFVTEASRIMGDIDMPGRYSARFTEITEKGDLQNGAGFNWQRVVSENSIPVTPNNWQSVQKNNGTNGTCVADASVVNGASSIMNYSAYQTALNSEDICLLDAQFGYLFDQQTENKKVNFERNISDTWNERDRAAFVSAARHKYVAASGLPNTVDDAGTVGDLGSGFPDVPATYAACQEMIEIFLRKLDRDGAEQAGGAYGMSGGRAIYLVLMESEIQEAIIKKSATTRQDFQWSDSGKGDKAVLREKMGLDRPYGGAFYMIDDRMPRFDFVGGTYVERPFFSTSAATIGVQAVVSTAYENAAYTMIIFHHPKVVKRLMPKAITTAGAGTKFGPISYNGDIAWLNIPNAICNPKQTIGNWRADLMAAYEPNLVRYGYCLMVPRCTNTLYSFGTCY